MSANNYLLISGSVGNYDLLEKVAEDCENDMLMDYGNFNTLEDACRKAQEIMHNDTIEYGTCFNIE